LPVRRWPMVGSAGAPDVGLKSRKRASAFAVVPQVLIEIRGEKRAIIPAIPRGISKIVGTAEWVVWGDGLT
jgi:hypothetical protein